MAEDIGVHQQERLVELLTSQECEDLLFALSHPEENVFQHLERLSAEKNQLDVKPRAKRDTSSAAGRCSSSSETHLCWDPRLFRPQRTNVITQSHRAISRDVFLSSRQKILWFQRSSEDFYLQVLSWYIVLLFKKDLNVTFFIAVGSSSQIHVPPFVQKIHTNVYLKLIGQFLDRLNGDLSKRVSFPLCAAPPLSRLREETVSERTQRGNFMQQKMRLSKVTFRFVSFRRLKRNPL